MSDYNTGEPDVVSLFPGAFAPPFEESVVKTTTTMIAAGQAGYCIGTQLIGSYVDTLV